MLSSLRNAIAAIELRQWIGAGIALTAVGSIASLFFVEHIYGYWKPEPEIVYFQNWDATRTAEDAAAVQAGERRMREDTEALAARLADEAMAGISAAPAETGADPAGASAAADKPPETTPPE
ncbi:hypothetical protein KCG44_05380 [Pacificimonas sp. WHA3]|uniref:Uncharacterized protein n=1 Tax=Pacificimonas pallii TaxID=2827236 RepID=A0ABS6SCR3_9SPHN|nr:hypothetical protein [Pacificimonas pallii]MBV7256213.1 hypothetical protein [Pacificimonas pallii]